MSNRRLALSGPIQPVPMAAMAMMAARSLSVNEFQQPDNVRRSRTVNLPRILQAMHVGTPIERVQAAVALQEFMSAPSLLAREYGLEVREMITAGSFPVGANAAAYIDKFLITAGEMDLAYEEIFAIHDEETAVAQQRKDGFKVLDITFGRIFKRIKNGEEIEYADITGGDKLVPYEMDGGGLPIQQVWWDDQDYLSIAEVIQAFRDDAYSLRADAFYGAITGLPASGGSSINLTGGADLVEKINLACAKIIRALQGKGQKISSNSQFIILCAPEKLGPVKAALNLTSDVAQQMAGGKQSVNYRCKPISSVRVPASGDGSGIYVILPKGKLKGGYRMDLTLFADFNINRYATSLAGFQRYGLIAGEAKQAVRIP